MGSTAIIAPPRGTRECEHRSTGTPDRVQAAAAVVAVEAEAEAEVEADATAEAGAEVVAVVLVVQVGKEKGKEPVEAAYSTGRWRSCSTWRRSRSCRA